MLEPCERGEPHPRLGLPPRRASRCCARPRLGEALDGAELVVHAVNSDGAVPVMTRAAAHLPDVPVLSVTKGLLESPGTRRMDRIDLVVSEHLGRPVRFVHAAGPAKAMEIARRRAHVDAVRRRPGRRGASARGALRGDGPGRRHERRHRGGGALLGAQERLRDGPRAVGRLRRGRRAQRARRVLHAGDRRDARAGRRGGRRRPRPCTAPAGVGDLHVTAAAGRNRAFGERVGRGEPAQQVAAEMLAAGELTEGYPAIATAWRFAREHGVTGLPLLEALHAIVWRDAPVGPTLAKLTLTA